MVAANRVLHCTTLRGPACLTVQEPQPSCSDTCSRRPFRIDVYGPNATMDVAAALRKQIRDPLNSFRLRHLHRDLFARNGTPPGRKK